MGAAKLDSRRVFLVRVDHDADLLIYVTNIAKENKISAATFTAIGAFKTAKIGFYDQDKHEYLEHLLSDPQEIDSCVGNISLKDNEPFAHAHVVLSDERGVAKGGHLLEGRVFAAEVHLIELLGEKVERKTDDVTGLYLWDI